MIPLTPIVPRGSPGLVKGFELLLVSFVRIPAF